MKRYLILLLLLISTNAHAFNLWGDAGMGFGAGGSTTSYSAYADLLNSLVATKGVTPLTFTRASSAYVPDRLGVLTKVESGSPAYDNVRYVSNLALRSQEINIGATWVPASSAPTITADNITAPDGTMTADKFGATGPTQTAAQVLQSITKSNTSNLYTYTVYAQKGEHNYLTLAMQDSTNSNGFYRRFDLNAGTTYASGPFGSGWSETASSIDNVGGGWFRCRFAGITDASTTIKIGIAEHKNSDASSVAVTTGQGIYLWGAQLETGSSASEYQPTTTAPVTAAYRTELNGSAIAGTATGVLSEPSGTNTIKQSSTFNTTWTLSNGGSGVLPILTPNYGVAPDGTSTAYRLQLNRGASNGGGDYSRLVQDSMQVFSPGTESFYVKSLSGAPVIGFSDGTNKSVYTTTTEWTRFSQTTATTAGYFEIRLGNTQATSQTADILIWGAQHESGSIASSPIPTLATSSTRATTVLSGTPSPSFAAQAGKTKRIRFGIVWRGFAAATDYVLWSSFVDASNYTAIIHNGTSLILRKRVAGTNYDATLTITAPTLGQLYTVDATISANETTSISMTGYSAATSSDTHTAAFGTTFQLGSISGASIATAFANFSNFRISSK